MKEAKVSPKPDGLGEEASPDHHHSMSDKRTYALTWDLGEKVQLFSALGLQVPPPNAEIFIKIKDDLDKMLLHVFGPSVHTFPRATRALASQIVAKTTQRQSELRSRAARDALVVSTCPEIANIREGIALSINRLIDEKGEILGLGPRPGAPSISDQMDVVQRAAGNRSVILMEDGAFTGGTMRFILNEMKARRVHVSAVVLGLAFKNAKESIAEVFDGDIVTVEEDKDYVDWMPDHDFFPFIPNSGRVFGTSWNGNLMPLYTKDGATFCAPYLLPFAPITKWASIPENHALDFSRFCLQKTREIFEKLCEDNDCMLTIEDIIDTVPRVSIPMAIGQQIIPPLRTRILDYLKACIDEID